MTPTRLRILTRSCARTDASIRLAVWALIGFALCASASAESVPAQPDRVIQAYKESLVRVEAGQLAEALGPAKRAYDYAQQDLSVDDEALALTAAALGELLLDLDRPVDALRPLTHAGELYDLQLGPTSGRARTVQWRIADANQRIGRFDTAERTYIDLAERAKQTDGDSTAELASIYAKLQTLTEEAGAKVRSRRYGLRSMKLYEQAFGKDSLQAGVMCVKVARLALEEGDWNQGLDLLDHGVPILEKRLEPGDPQLIVLYEFLVELYESADDQARHRRYRIRLKKAKSQAADSEPAG